MERKWCAPAVPDRCEPGAGPSGRPYFRSSVRSFLDTRSRVAFLPVRLEPPLRFNTIAALSVTGADTRSRASAPAPVQEDADGPVSPCWMISAVWRGATRRGRHKLQVRGLAFRALERGEAGPEYRAAAPRLDLQHTPYPQTTPLRQHSGPA